MDTTTRHVALLRRNAAIFQLVFATFWFVRLTLAWGSPEAWLVMIAGTTAATIGTRRAWRAATGLRARDEFRTPAGRAFMRPVTVISTVQLISSIVLPWIASATGHSEWVAPSIAITIGLFLMAFAGPLQVPEVRRAGVVATLVPAILPFVLSGDALVAAVAATLGAALTASVWWCAVADPVDPPNDVGTASEPGQLHTAFTCEQRGGNGL